MDTFSVSDLVAGDILLYRATDSITNLVSALIRKLDGTEVSHAGLFMGDCVGEALAVGEHAGLGAQPLTGDSKGVRESKGVRTRESKGVRTRYPEMAIARPLKD